MKPILIPENYTYISAFLTMRCNLKCSYCLNEFEETFTRKWEEINSESWISLLNRIHSKPDIPITLSGGEPSLHKGFIEILKNVKKDLSIDILTNLQWTEELMERFLSGEIQPERLKRNSAYASIRVSYHPEQMDIIDLVKKAKRLQDAGFSIGIWGILYPSPAHLTKINEAQFVCKDFGVDFRLKEYTGEYNGVQYGNYSKYPGSISQEEKKTAACKTTELLIGPNGNVYRCHSDLYGKENSIGSVLDPEFEIKNIFRECKKYGFCHPCDVKVKTNYKQQLGHTSVDIKLE